MRLLHLAVTVTILANVHSYKHFQLRIPNGNKIPHPCDSTRIWKGVGHKNMLGGGERNPFGLAFAANGYMWDATLCQMDSDGDGKSNGYELGDPACTWREGLAISNPPVSHPGVCEPVNSEQCKGKNNWDVCGQKEFQCNGIKEQGVQERTLRLDDMAVPATETNYYCQLLELPSDNTYDIIAQKPKLVNEDVIHHMLLYGCNQDISSLEKFRTPQPCGMLFRSVCGHTIGGWTVGNVGDCYDGIPAATRIGKNHFTMAMLEVHWNNPEKRSDYRDSSGLTLFFTHNLRPHALGVLTMGPMALKIPPKSSMWKEQSTCTPHCTEYAMSQNVTIVSAGLHMHYAGVAGTLDLYRENTKIATIIDEKDYSYDKPLDYNHYPGIEMWPGDELKMSCTFNTMDKTEFVYYGDATSDEMCFSFISYYPKLNFNECLQVGSYDFCTAEDDIVNGCDTWNFDNLPVVNELYTKCATDSCTPECLKLFSENPPPCLRSNAKLLLEVFSQDDIEFQRLMRSCDLEIYRLRKPKKPPITPPMTTPTSASPHVHVTISVMLAVLILSGVSIRGI